MTTTDEWLVAEEALHAAGVGGWQIDLESGTVRWTRITYAIHELPETYVPNVDDGLTFYPSETRTLIKDALRRCVEHGEPWDLEVPFRTAKGRAIWVRACGRAIYSDGRIVRIVGTFQDVTAKREMLDHLDRLSMVARQVRNSVLITDQHGRTEWVNGAFTVNTGYALADAKGRTPGSLLQGPMTDPATVSKIREALREGRGFDVEIINYTRTGTPYWTSISCSPMHDAEGQITGFISIQNDITKRREAEQTAQREIAERQRWQGMMEAAIESLADGFVMFDREDRLITCNARFKDIYRLSAPFIVPGAKFEDIVRQGASVGQYPQCGPDVETFVATEVAWHRDNRTPIERMLPDGRWILTTAQRTPDGGTVGIRADITRLKSAEAEAVRRSEQDALTGLANRAALNARLSDLAHSSEEEGSLVLFDLDHFKSINDSHGHPAGDELLRRVAERLRNATRPTDMVARLGGDEFAIWLPGMSDPTALSGFLTRMKETVEKPVRIDGITHRPSLSVGAARYPHDANDMGALMSAADTALYDAKRQGRNRWMFYDRQSAITLQRRSKLADRLAAALKKDRIEIVLQPKIRAVDETVVGFEALARWRDEGELIPPDEFIFVAEEHGLGLEVGWAVLRKALAAQAHLLASGLEPGRMAVNFTTSQVLEDELISRLARELLKAGLSPQRLEVEITETVLVDRSAQKVKAALNAVADLGIGISLDDFGTGYASLSHLANMPVGQLKIDRQFIQDLPDKGRGATIVRSVIALARGLGIETVAEGVETQEQLAALREEGCDVIQGYLYSRPLSIEMAKAWLRQHEQQRPPIRGLFAELR